MLLLNIISIDAIKYFFYIAFAFLSSEIKEDYM